MPVPAPRQKSIAELILQLEDASGQWYAMNYKQTTNETTEIERAQTLSWVVGCRMELQHAIKQEREAAVQQALLKGS
jgi:hypothetical protein